MTDYERIKSTFEGKAVCRHKNKPLVNYEPGCMWIECSKGDDCKCRLAQDSGEPVTFLLVEWRKKFG